MQVVCFSGVTIFKNGDPEAALVGVKEKKILKKLGDISDIRIRLKILQKGLMMLK